MALISRLFSSMRCSTSSLATPSATTVLSSTLASRISLPSSRPRSFLRSDGVDQQALLLDALQHQQLGHALGDDGLELHVGVPHQLAELAPQVLLGGSRREFASRRG